MNLVKTTLHNDTQINFGNIEPVTTHMNTKTCVDVQRRFFIVDDINFRTYLPRAKADLRFAESNVRSTWERGMRSSWLQLVVSIRYKLTDIDFSYLP